MMKFKGCPRCGGDAFIDWDFYGWYEQCIQCGYMHYMESTATVKAEKSRPVAAKSKNLARAA